MKLSEAMKIGMKKTYPLEGGYIKRLGNGVVKACPLGAAMIAKDGPDVHISSITEIHAAFPDVPISIMLKMVDMIDKPYKGQKYTREEVAAWLEEKGL